jgi:hypothetical protein
MNSIKARPILTLEKLWEDNFIDELTETQFGILDLVRLLEDEEKYDIMSASSEILVKADTLEEVVEISELISEFIFGNRERTQDIIFKFDLCCYSEKCCDFA